jgi:hypothetical protein
VRGAQRCCPPCDAPVLCVPLLSVAVFQVSALVLFFVVVIHADQNQWGVGQAIKGRDRKSYFLTTKTPPCRMGTSVAACTLQTQTQLAQDLEELQLDYLDLVLIHGSDGDSSKTCDEAACELDYAQWSVCVMTQYLCRWYARARTFALSCVGLGCGRVKRDLRVCARHDSRWVGFR